MWHEEFRPSGAGQHQEATGGCKVDGRVLPWNGAGWWHTCSTSARPLVAFVQPEGDGLRLKHRQGVDGQKANARNLVAEEPDCQAC